MNTFSITTILVLILGAMAILALVLAILLKKREKNIGRWMDCPFCGYPVLEEFNICPRCGRYFEEMKKEK